MKIVVVLEDGDDVAFARQVAADIPHETFSASDLAVEVRSEHADRRDSLARDATGVADRQTLFLSRQEFLAGLRKAIALYIECEDYPEDAKLTDLRVAELASFIPTELPESWFAWTEAAMETEARATQTLVAETPLDQKQNRTRPRSRSATDYVLEL
ncbi:Uncharacterised protein [Mycobacteroides abscessus subsp. abscessus]|uniref:hypothetical protein n=1 Tax=Mycobacteroides abscessus TaxID=36809 RepID=UPI000926A59C|nr:hypothetical protein [Mycobacteroides abscessus]SIH19423.1 Uncharacterised protein [Mycobacteroides abscessus subsp. abscessus]